MLHPDTGAPAGVLCLCFDFEAEMAGIFDTHRDPGGRYNLLLLDRDSRVIASADAGWIAPGARVPVNHESSHRLQMYCGRLHLVRTVCSRGYQGYMGSQGWCGQVMLPLDVAFYGQDRSAIAASAPELVRGLQTHSLSFCPPLHAIRVATDTVRRTVWNGQVMRSGQASASEQLGTIIEQIGDAGARSNTVFEQASSDLSATAIGAGLDRVHRPADGRPARAQPV
ncbi:MAG: hypothetical protein ABWY05_08660 [Noviherbaspirillum sp.]